MLPPFVRLRRIRPAELRFALAAWLLAPVVVSRLRRDGLEATLRHLEDEAPRRVARWAGDVRPARAERAVAWAFRVQPLARSACLGRALVQHQLHRAVGRPHRFVVGVRRGESGIGAHAWVDDGAARSDAQDFDPILIRTVS